MDNHVTATECRMSQELMRPLTPEELRYCADCANIRADLFPMLTPDHIKRIDGTFLFGVPLRDMNKTELMAFLIMLEENYSKYIRRSNWPGTDL